MSLEYFGLGPYNFLDTMYKQILQVETKETWSRSRQILGLGPSSFCRYLPGQLTKWILVKLTKMMMCDVLSPIRLFLGCFSKEWPPLDDVTST